VRFITYIVHTDWTYQHVLFQVYTIISMLLNQQPMSSIASTKYSLKTVLASLRIKLYLFKKKQLQYVDGIEMYTYTATGCKHESANRCDQVLGCCAYFGWHLCNIIIALVIVIFLWNDLLLTHRNWRSYFTGHGTWLLIFCFERLVMVISHGVPKNFQLKICNQYRKCTRRI